MLLLFLLFFVLSIFVLTAVPSSFEPSFKAAFKTFSIAGKNYGYGTLLIPVQRQKQTADELHQLIEKISQNTGVVVENVSTYVTHDLIIW